MKKQHRSALVVTAFALAIATIAALSFLGQRIDEPIVTGPGVTAVRKLSEWFPGLAGTAGDTVVYVLKGEASGGSMLVLGGTHPNEPSSFLAAVLLIENSVVQAGTLYVIPRANASGFTHNDPQEGAPKGYDLGLGDGSRRFFRYGSRATNPVHQWPDPEVYIHAASGQRLSGNETRNLNRGYPGRPDGTLTERICYGITSLIRTEKIDITIDLHEASPEYPVVNAVVAHERAMPLASNIVLGLEMLNIKLGMEKSPRNLRGLSHRELGDATDSLVVLLETVNPSQGRLRGPTNELLVLSGRDRYYVKAKALERLYVPFDENGHPIAERVGRHLAAISEFALAISMEYHDRPLEFIGLPGYEELIKQGVGSFLRPVK